MDLFASPERARELTQSAHRSVVVDPDQLPMLELLVSGALFPSTGFMGAAACAHVQEHMRLPDGTFWPRPIVLDVAASVVETLELGQLVILRDPEGDALAALHLAERWQIEEDTVLRAWRVAGRVEGLSRPRHYDFREVRRTPAEARAALIERGWSRVLACPLDRAVSAADEARLDRLARSVDADLALHAALDTSDQADERPYTLIRSLSSRIPRSGLLSALPWNRRWPVSSVTVDPSWAAFGAVVARNHGCSHVLFTPEARDALEGCGIHADELGIVPVASRIVADAPIDSRGAGGTTIFFTGLSGSGKSTIANAVRVLLMERGIRVTLLDGDLVRRHLSSDLGFSREHRELNVLRIGYVASEITRHGGIAICAPIAPYADVRRRVRETVEAVGTFVLVFVDTPIETCERRDPKGLYARARAGSIPEFTGVSDPYEPPVDADLVIRTIGTTPVEAAERIVRHVIDARAP
jgi:sulfate adenylyltransferase